MKTRTKILFAGIIYRFLASGLWFFGKSPAFKAKRHGIVWCLRLREGVDLAIFLFGRWERRLGRAYDQFLKPGDVVVDVGANVGAHTLHFAKSVSPGGKVFAFEPADIAFVRLEANLSLNPELRHVVKSEQAAVAESTGASIGPVYSSWPLINDGSTRHRLHGGMRVRIDDIPTVSLDDFFSSHKPADRLNLLKIDVDGRECEVLRGAREVIGRYRPILIVEVSPYQLDEFGASIDELFSLLDAADYTLHSEDDLLPIMLEVARLIPVGASMNGIGIPNEQGLR